MTSIALGQYSYRRAEGLLPSVNLLNVFFEKTPTNLRDQVVLLTRPTLDSFAKVGLGPIRAVFWEEGIFNSDALVVSGKGLYRVNHSGSSVLIGAVPGNGIVEIACSTDTALIAGGGPLLQTDGVTVTSKAFPDSQLVKSVGFINGYFIAVPNDSHRLYYIDLLTGEFDGTRFISAERYPDDVEKIIVTSDEVWAMGAGSVEVFVPTGVDTSEQPPFQRVEGRVYKKGVLNAATAVEADNSVYWVGQSKDGGPTVYRGEAVPIAVSDASVAEHISRCDLSAMTAWPFGIAGHVFYVLGLNSEGTWALDIATGLWYEWGSLNRSQWRAWLGRGVWDGDVLAGDIETGDVWRLDAEGVDDAGTPVKQVFTAGVPIGGRVVNANVSLDCAVGQIAVGEKASINLAFSDDQGRTWQDEGPCSLGEQGDYEARVRWDRLGTMVPPMRIFQWTTTSRLRMRVNGARINDDY